MLTPALTMSGKFYGPSATKILYRACLREFQNMVGEMPLYTIAIDGDVGYFDTFRTQEGAETERRIWARNHPTHIYTVVKEDEESAAYAEQTGQVKP